MAQVNSAAPPVISTPSRPRKSTGLSKSDSNSSLLQNNAIAAFSPSGKVVEGYSYLSRSSSISTTTRSRPKGLQTKSSPVTNSPSLPVTGLESPSPVKTILDLSKRRQIAHRLPQSVSSPAALATSGQVPQPSTESERLAEAVSKLPSNPKVWIPSQVGLYLTHVLGLVPKPIVEDVTAYVRNSRMAGRAFIRLSEKDLEEQGLNLKWRKLMIEAVRKLRRDALRGRIWGFESDAMAWPRTTDKEDNQPSSPDENEPGEKNGIVKSSKGVSKLTLQRMRDSKKVQGMIQAFQSVSDKPDLPSTTELDHIALGMDQIPPGYVSSLSVSATTMHTESDTNLSPKAPMAPIYGSGYVRDQADSFMYSSELSQVLESHRPTRPPKGSMEYPWLCRDPTNSHKGDFESLLASLSEQEADELASELGLDDLQDPDRQISESHRNTESGDIKLPVRQGSTSSNQVVLVPTLHRYGREPVPYGSESSIDESGDSEADLTENPTLGSRFGLLDQEVIKAILAESETDTESDHNKDPFLSGMERDTLKRSHTSAALIYRPEHPYRASLYTEEEIAFLQEQTSHGRTESAVEMLGGLGLENAAHDLGSPKFDTAKKRSTEEERINPILSIFDVTAAAVQSQSDAEHPCQEQSEQKVDDNEYIFELPDDSKKKNKTSPSASTTGSIRKNRNATFGSKRGKKMLSMSKQGMTGTDNDPVDLLASAQKDSFVRSVSGSIRAGKGKVAKPGAEDEEGWGGTLGRQSSRKSLNQIFAADNVSQIKGPSGQMTPIGFQKRHLERVYSEAYHETLDRLDAKIEKTIDSASLISHQPEDIKVPFDRYEDKCSASSDDEHVVGRKPSVEKRLSDLFSSATSIPDSHLKDDENTEPQQQEIAIQTDEKKALEEIQYIQTEVDPIVAALAVEDHSLLLQEGETDACAETPANVQPQQRDDCPTQLADSSQQEDTDNCLVSSALELDTNCMDEPAESNTNVNVANSEESIPIPNADQLVVCLNTIEPHPSGTGSIRKRSMVLVDRKRYESLSQRVKLLENQIDVMGKTSTSPISRRLDQLFSNPHINEVVSLLPNHHQEPIEQMKNCPKKSWSHSFSSSSSWTNIFNSLNPFTTQPNTETVLNNNDLEEEALSLGVIPAYMLGLGAGVGFVLIRQVFLGTR